MQLTVSPSVETGTAGILDGETPLRFAYWQGSSVRGTIILVTGRGEFIEVYAEAIADLRERGYAVLAYDHRGQGASGRLIPFGGHVRAFADYTADLEAMVRVAAQTGLPRPYHIVAHSMGGLVALLAAPRIAEEVERMVLLAPMLEIAGLPARPGVVAAAANALCLAGQARRPLSRKRTTTPFASNRLTTDAERYAAMCSLSEREPALMVGPPTVGWLAAAFRAMRRAWREEGELLPVPTLFVASGADAIVSTAAIDRFARNAMGGGLVTIPGARHHVLLERDELRRLALAAIDAFLADAPTRLTETRSSNFARPLRVTPIAPIAVPARSQPEALGGGAAAAPRRGWRVSFPRLADAPPADGDAAEPVPPARRAWRNRVRPDAVPVPSPSEAAAARAADAASRIDPRPVSPDGAAASPARRNWRSRSQFEDGRAGAPPQPERAADAPPVAAGPAETTSFPASPAPDVPPRRGWRKARNADAASSPSPVQATAPHDAAATAAAPPPRNGVLRRRPAAADDAPADSDAGSEKLRQRLRRRRERRGDDPSEPPAAATRERQPDAARASARLRPAEAPSPHERAAAEATAGERTPEPARPEPAAAPPSQPAPAMPRSDAPAPAAAHPEAAAPDGRERLTQAPKRGVEPEAARGLLAAPPPPPSRRPRRTFRR